MQAPILTVQIGMGENILILAFVVIIIGGIGSIRGAFIASFIVGLIDTIGRAFLPDLLRLFLAPPRVDRRAGDVVDDDLSADGGRAGVAAGGCFRRAGNDDAVAFHARAMSSIALPGRRSAAGAALRGSGRQQLPR